MSITRIGIRPVRLMNTWSSSAILTDRKSRFQGHATRITSSTDVPALLSSLVESEKSLQKASHPTMYAWRTQSNQGMSDCGEAGAGLRLMGLLERTGLYDILIVVTRWYGGTPLGGARFRHISSVAVEALKNGGLLEEPKKTTKKKKK